MVPDPQGWCRRHTTRSPRVPRRFVGVYRGGRTAQWLGQGRRHTTRSPRVARRFVGVYRGARTAQCLGQAVAARPVRPSARRFVATQPVRPECPDASSPHNPFAPSAPTLRRGVTRGPHSSVFGAGPSPHEPFTPSARRFVATRPVRPSARRFVATRPVHPECPDASSGCIEGPAQLSVWGRAHASIGDRAARDLRYAPVKAPALLRVNGLCVPSQYCRQRRPSFPRRREPIPSTPWIPPTGALPATPDAPTIHYQLTTIH